jgi:uncharacterized membrane protein YfcA
MMSSIMPCLTGNGAASAGHSASRRDPNDRMVLQNSVRRPKLGRWAALGVACAMAAALAGHYGPHGGLVMLGVGIAALASSIAGFAFSAIAGAMLFHLGDDPVRIVQIMMACSVANQAAMTWAMRRSIEWRGLLVLLAGGMAGLVPGVWLLVHADRLLYTHALGIFLLAYGSVMLLRKPITLARAPVALDVIAGFLGGVTGGAAGFPGAAVTIWCGTKGWDKARQRATYQPFILIMQIAGLIGISLARGGATPVNFDFLTLLFIPASLLGTASGLLLFERMTDRQFARAVNLLLMLSGVSYIV